MSPLERVKSYVRGPLRRTAANLGREFPIRARALGVGDVQGRLPAFLIIGAQKSGTTSLYRYLEGHPQVAVPLWKEPRYFDEHYGRGLRWYAAHFANTDAGVRTFEATTGYLYHPKAPERIGADLPNAKLIALLRNPIDRAVSHYLHERRRGWEMRTMEEAFADDMKIESLEQDNEGDAPILTGLFPPPMRYLGRGLYARQAERYFQHVGRERVRFYEFDSFFRDPAASFADALDFIELDAYTPDGFEKHNVGGRTPVHAFDREAVADFFKPYNESLSEMLGLDVSGWG